MNSHSGNRIAAALAAGVLAVTLAACGADTETPQETPTGQATEATPTAEATPTPEVTEEPTPEEPKDPSLEVTIDGVTYTGTEEAPLKIGDDTPGQPPAAEEGFPGDPTDNAFFEAGRELGEAKYIVLVKPTYADDDPLAEGDPVGWGYVIYGVAPGSTSWRGLDGEGTKSFGRNLFPTKEAAEAGPFLLHGRELDRSEYIYTSTDSMR